MPFYFTLSKMAEQFNLSNFNNHKDIFFSIAIEAATKAFDKIRSKIYEKYFPTCQITIDLASQSGNSEIKRIVSLRAARKETHHYHCRKCYTCWKYYIVFNPDVYHDDEESYYEWLEIEEAYSNYYGGQDVENEKWKNYNKELNKYGF